MKPDGLIPPLALLVVIAVAFLFYPFTELAVHQPAILSVILVIAGLALVVTAGYWLYQHILQPRRVTQVPEGRALILKHMSGKERVLTTDEIVGPGWRRDIALSLKDIRVTIAHHEEGFARISAAYEATIEKIGAIEDTSEWTEKNDSVLSQLYVAFGDCFFANTGDEEYYKHRSLKTAIERYQKAYTLDEQAYSSRFAYAQALGLKAIKEGNKEDAEKASTLFGKVFAQGKEEVARTTEAATLITLYYMLAICCKEAMIRTESPVMYLMEIRKQAPVVPCRDQIRILSPRTRNRVRYADLMAEVEDYEATFKDETLSAR